MKKKVKKVPKYDVGTDYIVKNTPRPYNIQQLLATKDWWNTADLVDLYLQQLDHIANETFWTNENLNKGLSAASTAVNLAANSIGKPVTVGGVISGIGQGAATGASVGGPWGALVGGIAGGALSAIGTGGSVDENTGEVTNPSGIAGLFGHSKGYLRRKSNIIKNSNLARLQTENLQANWMNQGINPAPNTLAAEGAIIDNSTQVLVSPGELIYDYKNKTLTKVPFGDGKPNTDDNVFMKVEQGDKKAVINNKADMGTTVDGKTLAMQLEPMTDKPNKKFSKGTIDARDAIVKKALRIQEQHKTGSQEYAAFNEGIDSTDKVKNGGGNNPYAPSNMGNNTWWTYIKKLADQFGESVEQFLNRAKLRGEDLAKFGSTGLIPYVNPTTGTVSFALPWGSNYIDGSTRADDVITNEKVVTPVVRDGQTVVVPLDDKKGIKKASNAKVAANKELSVVHKQSEPKNEKATPEQFAENLKSVLNDDIGERHWLRGPIETKSLTRVAFENAPKPIAPPFTVLRPEQDADVNYSNPSWQDWLYRTALLTQPLWDRAKAEPVQYEIPNVKYVPTGVDVSGQLRDVSEGYALSRYNFANLYPNTGAGMAAGLQAASTAAKQRADIHQYKTDAQNKLIGANVGIYNNWANRRAEILNDMYNKAAANRASARNINRQNRAAALSNYGQMLRDDKQYAMDTLKLDALTPLIMYGTENSDTLIKKARQILNK